MSKIFCRGSVFVLLFARTSTIAMLTHKYRKKCGSTRFFRVDIADHKRLNILLCDKNSNFFEDSFAADGDSIENGKIRDDFISHLHVDGKKNVALTFLMLSILAFCVYEIPREVNITSKLEEAVGAIGYVYFSGLYVLAEIFAVPAFPLTASSGYLFGLMPGFLTVLISATVAAGISFLIGRSYLKDWAQKLARQYCGSKWEIIDRAVSKEGFKVVLLLRLSPLLPFALSNYLYGITSVEFWQFLCGTFLGFSPGTFGIVYAGSVGKDLFSGSSGFSWYFYALVMIVVVTIGKTTSSAASAILEDMSSAADDINDKII